MSLPTAQSPTGAHVGLEPGMKCMSGLGPLPGPTEQSHMPPFSRNAFGPDRCDTELFRDPALSPGKIRQMIRAAECLAAWATLMSVSRTVPISSADDPRLADYTRLTDVGLRTHLEAEHGLFIAEGTKVITRAIAAGYPVRSVLLADSRLADLPMFGLADSGAPVYVVPDAVAERLTGYRVHRGALASLSRKPLPTVREAIKDANRIVVLEDLVDHGNVGAIFRCAAALGVDAVILSPRCADPLYRRSVKVSMGAVFAIRYARMAEWFDGLADLKNGGFMVLALTPDEQATPIDEALRAVTSSRWRCCSAPKETA